MLRYALAGVAVVLAAGLAGAAPAAPAAAATGSTGPVVKNAVVDVRPGGGRTAASVHEEIVLGGVTDGRTVRGKLARFDGVRIDGLTITAAGRPAQLRYRDAGRVAGVSFPAPTSGTVRLVVTYRVHGGPDATELPLFVPAYPGSGAAARDVTFRYHIPDGYHLQGDPFPVAIGDTGTQTRELAGVPTFLDYRLGTARPGPITPFNALALAVIAVIVVLSVITFRYEARSARRSEANV